MADTRPIALYARTSRADQHADAQMPRLRAYAAARGTPATEFVDEGVSGARRSRPALDALLTAARRREICSSRSRSSLSASSRGARSTSATSRKARARSRRRT